MSMFSFRNGCLYLLLYKYVYFFTQLLASLTLYMSLYIFVICILILPHLMLKENLFLVNFWNLQQIFRRNPLKSVRCNFPHHQLTSIFCDRLTRRKIRHNYWVGRKFGHNFFPMKNLWSQSSSTINFDGHFWIKIYVALACEEVSDRHKFD